MFWKKSDQCDLEYRNLCIESTAQDARLSEVAAMLVLAHTGIVVSDEHISMMADKLACVSEELGYLPDEMQMALSICEPSLYIEGME